MGAFIRNHFVEPYASYRVAYGACEAHRLALRLQKTPCIIKWLIYAELMGQIVVRSDQFSVFNVTNSNHKLYCQVYAFSFNHDESNLRRLQNKVSSIVYGALKVTLRSQVIQSTDLPNRSRSLCLDAYSCDNDDRQAVEVSSSIPVQN